MNWDQVEGKWKQLSGSIRQKWGKLTDDDLTTIAGSREKFVGKLQERYGLAREEAQKQTDEWVRAMHEKDERAFSKKS
ncbi:MAG TPA: CsbD family protein [Candidatus Acidoferrales bacterium]|nr:CsbD family protein [Candidatus Acidoferrales bacterium]